MKTAFFLLAAIFLLLAGCMESQTGKEQNQTIPTIDASVSPTATTTGFIEANSTATDAMNETLKAPTPTTTMGESQKPSGPITEIANMTQTKGCQESRIGGKMVNRTYDVFNGSMKTGDSVCLDNGARIQIKDVGFDLQFEDPFSAFYFFSSDGMLAAEKIFQVYPSNRTRFTNRQIDFTLVQNFPRLGLESYANVTIKSLDADAFDCHTSVLSGTTVNQTFGSFNGAMRIGDAVCLANGASVELADIGASIFGLPFPVFLNVREPGSPAPIKLDSNKLNLIGNRTWNLGYWKTPSVEINVTGIFAGLGDTSYANMTIQSR